MSNNDATGDALAPGWPDDWWELTAKSQRLAMESMHRQWQEAAAHPWDPFNLMNPLTDWLGHCAREPVHVLQAVGSYWQKQSRLGADAWQRWWGVPSQPVIEPKEDDRRFRHPSWREQPGFDFVKQSYLLYAEMVTECLAGDTPLDERETEKLRFFSQQLIDALAPTNFALTNPAVIEEAVNTRGRSLWEGYRNLLADWERSGPQFKVSLTDPEAFELGENIATTPGKVVFQNEYMQLIQYHPATDHAFKDPLLVVPPWINKYYILDLRPENSFLRWWVEQGHTVFVISWVNPDASYARTTFEHYMVDGVYAAVDAVEQITGEAGINAVGYCIGGTLLAATLAHMAAIGDQRIRSATFLTTLIDFSDPGEIRAFVDEKQVQNLEARMNRLGFLDGSAMASAFSMLRANDLIWSAFVNNYLLGKKPMAFDLLHWNADATRMPEAMHSFYLRKMYLENLLCQPGGIELAGQPLDMRRVDVPLYFLSTVEDHIAPWKSTYLGARLFSGPVRFVLGGSGHIAGVINAPVKGKYDYYVNERGLDADADRWLEHAERRSGSWWPDWQRWIEALSGEKVAARQPGAEAFPVIEDAPGSYARQRID